MSNLEWPDNAVTFNLLLFWYLYNFLEKDESGLLFQITIAWLVFIYNRTDQLKIGLYLSHIWIIHESNVRFALGLLYFFRFHFVFYLSRVMLDERIVHLLHIFMFFVPSWSGEQKVWCLGEVKRFRTRGVYQFGVGVILLGGRYPITCHRL